MLRSGTNFKQEELNVLIQEQGLGDMIANLPALRYIHKKYKHIKLNIWVPDFIAPLYRLAIPNPHSVRGYSEGEKKYKHGLATIATGRSNHKGINSMKIHPVDYAFLVLCNEQPEIEYKNYPRLDLSKIKTNHLNLPEKFVCISVGATAPVKAISGSIINSIAKHAIKKGYTPVFLGSTKQEIGKDGVVLKVTLNEEVDYSLGLDLTNKTNILETARIIDLSKCLIGMEGGLTHMAGLTDTPTISSYTFADPKRLMPIRNNILGHNIYPIEPALDLECRYCLTYTNFIYDHEFSSCFYGDYQCVPVHPVQFLLEMDKVL